MLPTRYAQFKTNVEWFIKDRFEQNYVEESKQNQALKRFFEATQRWFDGGKRFRGVLAQVAYFRYKDDLSQILPWAWALEFVHAFSLVHDDMPELDNDILRRWKPTVWAKYSDWEALLVGDNLMMIAFELLSEVDDKVLPQLLKLLSSSIGMRWMNGWQYMDVWYEHNPDDLNYSLLQQIHARKTGALINASLIWWAILWWASNQEIELISQYGKLLGMAFQISDDILDVVWTAAQTGKSVGGEQKWYVYFLGLEKAQQELKKIVERWIDIAQELGDDKLKFLIEFMLGRNN